MKKELGKSNPIAFILEVNWGPVFSTVLINSSGRNCLNWVNSRKQDILYLKFRNRYVHRSLIQLENLNRSLIEYNYTFHGEIYFCKDIKLAIIFFTKTKKKVNQS